MTRRSIVESRDERSPFEEAQDILRDSGCPETEAGWLASALMDPLVLAASDSVSTEGEVSFPARCRLEHFGRQFREVADRDLAILLGFERLGIDDSGALRQPDYGLWPFLESEAAVFLSLCMAKRIDFTSALLRAATPPRPLTRLAYHLYSHDAIGIPNAINHEKLLACADQPGWWPRSHSSMQMEQEDSDPSSLVFWLVVGGAQALDAVIPWLEEARQQGSESLAHAARAVGWPIGLWMLRPREDGPIHPTSYYQLGPEFSLRARRIFDLIDQAVGEQPGATSLELREVWLRYAWMAFDTQADTMPPELRTRLYRAASDEIGRLRPLFRRADEPGAADEFRRLTDFYSTCVHLVLDLGTLWQGLRPLLLAFCSLSTQAVATDLRYWHHPERDGPDPPSWLDWSIISSNIVAAVHNYSRREQEAGDPELLHARTEFAAFCLDRLKTAKRRRGSDAPRSSEDGHAPELVEPDPNWRECMIRAARDLRVNPRGKGHQILHHVCQNDPDEGVRQAARAAYNEMRAGWGSARRISPRTLLLRAFAWIRQGHLLSLGLEPDPVGVQRTRDEERRRTTEPDETFGV